MGRISLITSWVIVRVEVAWLGRGGRELDYLDLGSIVTTGKPYNVPEPSLHICIMTATWYSPHRTRPMLKRKGKKCWSPVWSLVLLYLPFNR